MLKKQQMRSKQYGDMVEFHCSKQLYEELPLRNRHLCKTIEKYQKPGRKSFLVAVLTIFIPQIALFVTESDIRFSGGICNFKIKPMKKL